ncbi:DUF5694 domain-containing protein [Niabella yanshanensis]|uniref:DUF5694 domain-containing protein n=1 Tax=Niabella yanshanensis TaxID=577386 RepID=A0ABZ0W074_9BACT|nr:DUF5694 domain-containing protein [Niabella yanshanensis]WQD36648.1 DUF5694 domain-containing protein [Niabella yanshanensis]
MLKLTFSCVLCLFIYLNASSQIQKFDDKFDDAIAVLNFGTFHFGYTPDATKVEFDEHNKKNQSDARAIAKLIAAFNPTVIIVERVPELNEQLMTDYMAYIANPEMEFKNPNEIQLLAYEVGRLSKARRIYGIDFHEGYNYNVYNSIKPLVDSLTYLKYSRLIANHIRKSREDTLSLKERLKLTNHPQVLDYLINVNADMLTYVSTKGNAEGANEAAKFYHRNLVMYSNLNQIPLTKNDRVFILMGAAHTAFFRDLMKRSPKYRLVDVFHYLK